MKCFTVFLTILLWASVHAGKDGRCPPTAKLSGYFVDSMKDVIKESSAAKQVKTHKEAMERFLWIISVKMGWIKEDGETIDKDAVLNSVDIMTEDECMKTKIREGMKICFLPASCSETETIEAQTIINCCWTVQHTMCEKTFEEDEKKCEVKPECRENAMTFVQKVTSTLDEMKNDESYTDEAFAKKVIPSMKKYYENEGCYEDDRFDEEKTKEYYGRCVAGKNGNDAEIHKIFSESIEKCFALNKDKSEKEREAYTQFCCLDIFKKVCESTA